jgi:hypothetical protein
MHGPIILVLASLLAPSFAAPLPTSDVSFLDTLQNGRRLIHVALIYATPCSFRIRAAFCEER